MKLHRQRGTHYRKRLLGRPASAGLKTAFSVQRVSLARMARDDTVESIANLDAPSDQSLAPTDPHRRESGRECENAVRFPQPLTFTRRLSAAFRR